MVNVEFEGTLAELVVDAVPERHGDVFVRTAPHADMLAVEASRVTLKGIGER